MKRFTAGFFAVVMLIASLCPSAMAASFSDTDGHWAEKSIDAFVGYGIVEGGSDGRFRPNDSISRAELAVILSRLFNYTSRAENTFKDLPDNEWYTDAVLKVSKADVMRGSDGYIRPTDVVSRQEAAVMIARAFSLGTSGSATGYHDRDKIASWASGAVASMSAAGYISGNPDGNFYPESPLTRAQAVTILDNIIERVYDYGGVVTRSGLLLYGSTWYDIFENVPVNNYFDTGVFSSKNGAVSYTSNGKSALLGIDVSVWQGTIDWQRVASDGIEFAMIRLGNRTAAEGEIRLDAQFLNNIAGAKANGIDVGVYFFSQAITEQEAVEEALFVLDNLSGWEITYPVVFDWEEVASVDERRTNGITKSMLNKCAIAFCDTVAEAGYEPMVYTNKWFGMNNFDLSLLTEYGLWFAGPETAYPTLYYKMDMWQFTFKGSVSGIAGDVDMNLCFVDYPGGVSRF